MLSSSFVGRSATLAICFLYSQPGSASRISADEGIDATLDTDAENSDEWFGRRCRAPETGNFHYQLQYEDGSQHAIGLTWGENNSSPTMTINDDMVWTVSLTDAAPPGRAEDPEEPRRVEWHLEPATEETRPEEPRRVDAPVALSVWAFRRVERPDMPDVFEVTFSEDMEASLAGGIYIPEHLVLPELLDEDSPQAGRALDVHSRLSAGDGARAAAGGVVHTGARVGMVAGAIVGTVAVGAVGAVSGALAIGTLAGDVAFTLLAGSGGLVTGGVAGRVGGAVLSLPGAAVSGAMAWIRGNRELRPFVASEQIFNQLKCHRAFADCGGDVFVLEGAPCPGAEVAEGSALSRPAP